MNASAVYNDKKRKHISLTIVQKVALLKEFEMGTSVLKLSEDYEVGRSTVYDLIKNKDRILKFYDDSDAPLAMKKRKTLRTANNAELDKVLIEWVRQKRRENVTITGPMITEQAKKLQKVMGINARCSFSTGWLDKFKRRHGMLQYRDKTDRKSKLPVVMESKAPVMKESETSGSNKILSYSEALSQWLVASESIDVVPEEEIDCNLVIIKTEIPNAENTDAPISLPDMLTNSSSGSENMCFNSSLPKEAISATNNVLATVKKEPALFTASSSQSEKICCDSSSLKDIISTANMLVTVKQKPDLSTNSSSESENESFNSSSSKEVVLASNMLMTVKQELIDEDIPLQENSNSRSENIPIVSFNYEELVKNLDEIHKPNLWWNISSFPSYVVCTKWNESYVCEQKVIVTKELKLKIFLDKEEVPTSIKINSIEALSSLLSTVNDL